METENEMKTGAPAKVTLPKRQLIFFLLLLALIGGAVLRSSIATRLDSFTIDEAYHIGAGAAYVQTGDFRLNPEHPPLVKLWVGVFVSGFGYQRTPYRTLEDKGDERRFVEEDIYLNNDPDAIQSRARAAMFALNGLLLFLFAVAVRRVFGDIIALAATAFLAIDPTVAAHLPVVMTDLPVALLSTTAVLLAVKALETQRAIDLVFAAAFLGLTLSTKHSAVITMAAVAIIGIATAIFSARDTAFGVRLRRVGLAAAVLTGALIVLWSFYLFRFSESPLASEEQFNRPLAGKISDVKSSRYRAGLNMMAGGHLFPRAYTWGMADTIRAGAEGRARTVFAFGQTHQKAPFYFFPGVIAVKLPLGLLLLTIIGTGLFIFRKIPREFTAPLLGVIGFALLFLIVLSTGSAYAGIRHALPIVPPLALLAALAIYKAFESKSYFLRGAVILGSITALASAIPVLRPWEYYNETVGGAANAYKYFGDEGIDAELRVTELVKYYNENLKPAGELPFLLYPVHQAEKKRRELDWVGKNLERDAERVNSETITGTIIIGARRARSAAFREATPIARFGNLFVFRGTFKFPEARNTSLTVRAMNKIYTAEPDIEGAIKLLTEVVAVNPKNFSNAVELGNQYLKLGKREEALRAYRIAQENAPAADEISNLLARQIERVETEPLEQISPLRNPKME
jgi:tetratricopeptide (TPR) repeat protein